MTSGRRDWTAGSMRARRRIYDAQVIEPGLLTDDAGAKGRYFSRRRSLPLFPPKSPCTSFAIMTTLTKVGR